MKKFSFLILIVVTIAFSILIAPSVAFAGVEGDAVPFEFATSDTDDFRPDDEYSITFAKEVTLNADTLSGAKVNVTVNYDETLELEPKVYDEVTVGATCKFILPVKLKLGENQLEISISKEGFETRSELYVIKRKDGTLLQSLQNMIVIPTKTE